jgi:hypothetical protein
MDETGSFSSRIMGFRISVSLLISELNVNCLSEIVNEPVGELSSLIKS